MANEPISPVLSFGIIVGGRSQQNAAIDAAIARIGLRVEEISRSVANTGLRVNFVFQIPGPLSQPDFEGLHISRLRRRDSLMLINVAVPATLTPEGVARFVRDLLEHGVTTAKRYIVERAIPVDTSAFEAAVQAICSVLAEASPAS